MRRGNPVAHANLNPFNIVVVLVICFILAGVGYFMSYAYYFYEQVQTGQHSVICQENPEDS